MMANEKIDKRGILRLKDFDASLVVSSNLNSTLPSIIDIIQALNFSIIFISFAKPSSTWLALLEKAGLNTEKIFFVDCSVQPMPAKPRTENVLFIQDPSDLTSIGISISQFLGVIPGKKAVIIDDIATLKIYNPENTVLRFAQFLIRKIKNYNSKLVVVASQRLDHIVDKLSPFFDYVIE
jgi:hypothetical protein